MTYPPVPPDAERPVELPDVPPEEGISTGDVADRVDEDPEEQRNLTDRSPDELAGDPVDSAPDPSDDT